MHAGCVKKAGDLKYPDKLHFLSFMVMELLGPSVGYFSLERQTYTTNTKLLVSHGLGMLKVRTARDGTHSLTVCMPRSMRESRHEQMNAYPGQQLLAMQRL